MDEEVTRKIFSKDPVEKYTGKDMFRLLVELDDLGKHWTVLTKKFREFGTLLFGTNFQSLGVWFRRNFRRNARSRNARSKTQRRWQRKTLKTQRKTLKTQRETNSAKSKWSPEKVLNSATASSFEKTNEKTNSDSTNAQLKSQLRYKLERRANTKDNLRQKDNTLDTAKSLFGPKYYDNPTARLFGPNYRPLIRPLDYERNLVKEKRAVLDRIDDATDDGGVYEDGHGDGGVYEDGHGDGGVYEDGKDVEKDVASVEDGSESQTENQNQILPLNNRLQASHRLLLLKPEVCLPVSRTLRSALSTKTEVSIRRILPTKTEVRD